MRIGFKKSIFSRVEMDRLFLESPEGRPSVLFTPCSSEPSTLKVLHLLLFPLLSKVYQRELAQGHFNHGWLSHQLRSQALKMLAG